ncbi:Conserved_hypothetical protein [Hexamita inflata]|uniref:RING-type domain-containing protein n=1 Tax=Hexamita inflata TaxID=28002 RepID=A0AA86PF27_9EUKA|nr:Conserved hypothetical protein [Hexamita inflata]CAI9957658.1 Conserved hypothetical protein [Hexamita inflata]CAI9963711.1 Conserved hypothetical protein [Hexamita inflata]CAI9964557.1 Conserved hypothetical protein [Hexamita inflata]
MSFSMEQLAHITDTSDFPSEEDEKKLILLQNHFDKVYPVTNHDSPVCKFCDEFYTKLVRTSCGCLICPRCIYSELPSIPLARCPYCSFTVEFDKKLAGVQPDCIHFDFSPANVSLNQQPLAYSSKHQIAELYPFMQAPEECALTHKQKILCRFHEAVSPYNSKCTFCCLVNDGENSLYKDHVLNCQNRAEQHQSNKSTVQELLSQDNLYNYQIRQDLLMYEEQFKDSGKALFSDEFFKANILPTHRAPFVPHLIVRKLLLEDNNQTVLQQRTDFWNFQLLLFTNPVDPQIIQQYQQITVALKITLPDNSTKEYQFWPSYDQMIGSKVLRHFGRIKPTMIGRYYFEVRIIAELQPGIKFGSKKVYQRVVNFQQMSKMKQYHLQDVCTLKQTKLFTNILEGLKLVDQGIKYLTVADGEEAPVIQELSMAQWANLLEFGSFAVSIKDTWAFLIALRGYSNHLINARALIAGSIFDVVVEIVDRFCDVGIIAKAFVELVYILVQNQGDFNILTLKVPGLFGRLRRSKNTFTDLQEKVDELLNGLFRVCVKAVEEKENEVTDVEKEQK